MPTLPKLKPPQIGLLKGLAVTLKTMLRPATTQQYPHVKPDLPPRTRGVIALMEENCTVCMLCARECPDWCIYIDSRKETVPTRDGGGRTRTRNVLDRFAIDFALCMYCGICVEVCPFDALFWSPEFEYSTYSIRELTHEKEQLRVWMDTVPPPPALEVGAETPKEIAEGMQAALKAAAREAQAAAPAAPATAGGGAEGRPAPEGGRAPAARPEAPAEEQKIEAQIDPETYDRLIAEGKPERVARAKAKAAFVRGEKARARAEQGGGS
jgi:NADH-quinone oxidoreductase subunit I